MGVEIKNAIIESVSLDCKEGFLSSFVGLDYGGAGQGFGGFALYLPKSFTHHKVNSPAGHWIYRVMEVAGVTDFNQVKGKSVRVQVENGIVTGIGHIIKDDWFFPKKDFEKASEKHGEA